MYSLTILIISLSFVAVVDGQTSGFDPTAIMNSYLQSTSFWYQTLDAVYSMTNSFLNLLSNPGIAKSIFSGYNINLETANFTDFQNANWTSPNSGAQTFATKVLSDNWIYVFTLVVGLVIIIFMYTSCYCFSCFRKCGCCCGKTAKKKKKSSDKYIIGVLYGVVGGLTALIFLAAFASLVSGTVLIDNFTKADNTTNVPIVGGFLGPVLGLIAYVDTVKAEINQTLDVDYFVNRIQNIAIGLKTVIKNELINACSSCQSLDGDFAKLTNSLNILQYDLTTMQNASKNLFVMYEDFNMTLENIRTKALNDLSSCTYGGNKPCDVAKTAYTDLTFLRDPTLFPDLSSYIDSLNKTKNIFPGGSLESAFGGDFINQFDQLTNTTRSSLQSLKDSVNAFSISDYLGPFLAYTNTSSTTPLFLTVTWSDIKTYLGYFVIALKILVAGIGLTLLPVVLLNLVGLILGPVCKGKKDGTSENVFVASSRASFGISVPLAPLAYILFIIGSIYYGEVCKDFLKGKNSLYFGVADRSVQSIVGPSLNSTIQDISFFQNVSSLTINVSNLNVLRDGIYGYCKDNQSIFNLLFDVVNFDNDTINETVYKLVNQVDDQIKGINLSSLITDETLKKINDSADQLNSFPSINVSELASAPLTLPTLDDLKKITEAASNDPTLNPTQQGNLRNIATTDIPNLNNSGNDIRSEEAIYIAAYENATQLINGTGDTLPVQLRNLTEHLMALKNEINNNTINKIVGELKAYIARNLTDFFYDLKSRLLNIVRCKPLYDIFSAFLTTSCETTINPLNAFWFSLSSSIILFIPSVFMGLWLGGLISRQKKQTTDLENGEEPIENKGEQPQENTDEQPANEEQPQPPPPPSSEPNNPAPQPTSSNIYQPIPIQQSTQPSNLIVPTPQFAPIPPPERKPPAPMNPYLPPFGVQPVMFKGRPPFPPYAYPNFNGGLIRPVNTALYGGPNPYTYQSPYFVTPIIQPFRRRILRNPPAGRPRFFFRRANNYTRM